MKERDLFPMNEVDLKFIKIIIFFLKIEKFKFW